ncbi:nickel pincer cofactor biosynthesis protein LarB [Desulfitispora alkaliphila]|uniref:nickel pincer cofactor biosynthesis protein LarB n=1 Tax=Desulfitispora alkaliphila TaxID=622674 RepID=UPI003D262536
MSEKWLKDILEQYKNGSKDLDSTLAELKHLPYEDLNYAKVDHHRQMRNGFPEVIFCQGKTPEQVVGIMKSLAKTGNTVMGTRANDTQMNEVLNEFPQAVHHPIAKIIELPGTRPELSKGTCAIVSAGTADMSVAEEAAITCELLGLRVDRIYDVGVAGIHRLFDQRQRLDEAQVLIVVAGMEGALASVVGGLVAAPVIAVPTSVGYGAQFSGLAPLLTMLNSCASGVGVVNIDNGFGAATLANSILRIGVEA